MKNSQFAAEAIISLILVALVIALLNPFYWWMPDMMTMTVVLALVIVFAIFAGFVWREKARDERELLHIMAAGRFAFLVGIAALVIGIALASFNHQPVNQWLVITLAAMVLGKILGLAYLRNKN